MKNKHIIKCMTAGVVALLLCVLAVMPAFAAIDPPMPSDGSVPGAIFVADGESELALSQTTIRFDIPELLKETFSSKQAFLAYDARMTATYTLHNPTDHIVTEQLLTPIGIYPDASDALPEGLDAYKYTVSIDGEQIKPDLRHAYVIDRSYFVGQSSSDAEHVPTFGLAYLSDSFAEHPILTPYTEVYVYEYRAVLQDEDVKHGSYQVEGSLRADPQQCAVFSMGIGYPSRGEDHLLTYELYAFREETFSICSVGEDVGEVAWRAHDYDDNDVDANVTLESRQVMTFHDFVMQGYDPQSGASEVDYYNAFVAYADDQRAEDTAAIRLGDQVVLSSQQLQPWQVFEVTLLPGQRTDVTVTAPLYPSIDYRYDPYVYTYAYAMTLDRAWSACGQTRVQINTEYFLCDMGRNAPDSDVYTETGNGYAWEGQADCMYLIFSLCEEKNPTNSTFWFAMLALVFILLVLFVIYVLPVLVIAAVIALVAVLIVRKVRKKRKLKEQSTIHTREPEKEDDRNEE